VQRCKNKNLFEQISSKDKLKQKIYELSKYNKVSFRDFIEELNSNQNISNQKKKDILYSLLNQGLMTLFWLYMKKGIVHNDINYDNLYIEKTNKSFIKFYIEDYNYKIKLEGYYLIINDFSYSTSIEFNLLNKIPEKFSSVIYCLLNPIFSFARIIELIQSKITNNYKDNIFENFTTINILYKSMIKSYLNDNSNLNIKIIECKKYLFNFMNEKIFNYFYIKINNSNNIILFYSIILEKYIYYFL